MSHVMIGMARGSAQTVVMDGIVLNVGESQQWSSEFRGSIASRGQAITGSDFTWFFRSFNFYTLTFYGLTSGTGLAGALNFVPIDLIGQLNKGMVGGTNSKDSSPVIVGRAWYNQVMIGEHGIMNSTYVPYKPSGTNIPFSKAIASTWENYPDVFIPYGDNFMAVQETWMDKLMSIFPWPWYECFVTTAAEGDYARVKGSEGVDDKGTVFTMSTMIGARAAGPKLVIRINPWPRFNAVPSGSGNAGSSAAATPGELDMKRWNALSLFDFTKAGYGFINSTIQFGSEGAYNFYQFNPSTYSGQMGLNNSNNIPVLFQWIAAADAASIQRYGFRPYIGTTHWMFDPQGDVAQHPELNVQNTVLQLTANYVSWIHPEPLMAHATVTVPLNPALAIGNKFRYAPFKSGEAWDFYIESVQHRFVFGGPSTTTLSLTRGLPTLVYAASSGTGLLRDVMIGNAMRKDGQYVSGLPKGSAAGLQFIVTQDQAAALGQKLGQTYVTPQPQGGG
jgi:hypothetical protein